MFTQNQRVFECNSQKLNESQMNGQSVDDEIVISGISGRFPESSSVEEFRKQLFDGVDLVSDDERRWPSGIHGLPTRSGKLKNLDHFDAMFFGISAKQTNCMDPSLRILLELTHEALIDAGLNPFEVRGSKTGVFIGTSSSASESEEYWTSHPNKVNGYGLTGCCRTMLANRISYTFDFNGTSCAIDTACSSSLCAVQQAVAAIKSGQCESAIVGGVNLLLKPTCSLQLYRLHMLNPDGKCKAFDESAHGYVRSEAVVVIYLQKANVSRRIYATIVGAKTNSDGYKEDGVTFPSELMQTKLIRELYEEVGVHPSDVTYIEAHGTGTKIGDPQEVNSIASVFCEQRKTPLLIGSVKSNMGHAEPASGLCSIVKVIIAMETGIIPPNLHFKNPNPEILALNDGSIKVIDKNQPWLGGYVGINSFGFGGVNVHVILKSNSKLKTYNFESKIPRIYPISGRTSESVTYFLDNIEKQKDNEIMSLLHEIHKKNIPGHNYRGYSIFENKSVREIGQVESKKRPIWFVYSGMGSQWSQMGRCMMELKTFKASITKCADILKPYGTDLEEILVNASSSAFDNLTTSFVAITAVQIALTDTLKSLDIHPDGIIGHSLGEVGCAYADGSFTAKQTILSSFLRGEAVIESDLPEGMMASVGLSWEECIKRCPSDIFPACHNCQDNVTVSGPVNSIKRFVEKMKAENIFAKIVRCGGKAFHSRYIANTGPKLQKALSSIIPTAKPRTSKWISSSIPEIEWNTSTAKLNSARYHVNNLLSPVLFYEAIQHVPENAIVIEIAPHSSLRAILKRSLGHESSYIELMNKNCEDNLNFFINSLGRLYTAGANPNFLNLYDPISYPVGRGTLMLQSLIKWDHSTEWSVPNFNENLSKSGETVIEVDTSKAEYKYLKGCIINGRIQFPVSGYLVLVWQTFAKLINEDFKKLPIVFENIQIHRNTVIPEGQSVKFSINILESCGNFEVRENGTIAASGRIYVSKIIKDENFTKPFTVQSNGDLMLTSVDIYKELRLRGYDYVGVFKGVFSSDNRSNIGLLEWNDNWISFIDTMLQFFILGQNCRDILVPSRIQMVAINPKSHLENLISAHQTNEPHAPVYKHRDNVEIKSGGIDINGIDFKVFQKEQNIHVAPKFEKYVFVPYENNESLCRDFKTAKIQCLTILLQTTIENCSLRPKIIEIVEEDPIESLLAPEIIKILKTESLIQSVEYTISTYADTSPYQNLSESIGVKIVQSGMDKKPIDQNNHLIVTKHLIGNKKTKIIQHFSEFIEKGGFILTEETTENIIEVMSQFNLELVSKQTAGSTTYLLLRKAIKIDSNNLIIHITENSFDWIESVQEALKKSNSDNTKIYLVAQNEDLSGIMGLTTCIYLEPGYANVRSIFTHDKISEEFSITSSFFTQQLKKDLVFNVFKNGAWGTYRHLLLDNSIEDSTVQVENAYIDTLIKGDLSSLRRIEKPQTTKYSQFDNHDAEKCTVYCVALNTGDNMLASDNLRSPHLSKSLVEQKSMLGPEFSGRDTQGCRVMGMVTAGRMATSVMVEPEFLWKIPEHWSMEEASTVPVAYSLAYYALKVRGAMKPGESILIPNGTVAISQAAISISLCMDCSVFTTVSTQKEREYIKTRFPQLTDNSICNFWDSTFEITIFEQTKGLGVHFVLNSNEKNLSISLKYLAQRGRYIEIREEDNSSIVSLDKKYFSKNITFDYILLDELVNMNKNERKKIWSLISTGIQNGSVRPLPAIVVLENQMKQAFHFNTDEHISRVILKIRTEENRKTQQPSTKLVPAVRRTYMDHSKTYLLIGGLGGFGLELANWLIDRGATKIIFNSRNGIKTGYQSLCIRRWRETGIKIVIDTTDVSTKLGAEKFIVFSNSLGPVGGIFNLALVLQDGLMKNQTVANFEAVCRPKVDITKNLDIISRILCPNLNYFVVFSSMSCGRGNRGQTNYGLANSVMERICEARKKAGFPGLAIQWGPIGDVGIVADTMDQKTAILGGCRPQKIYSCLQVIDFFLQQPYPVLVSIVLAEKQNDSLETSNNTLTSAIANVLGIKDHKTIKSNSSFADLGLDSIMLEEIQQILKREGNTVLTSSEIKTLTFRKLTKLSSFKDSKLTNGSS